MTALKPGPPFGVLVMSEESRLGLEAIETAFTLKQLVTSGVRVFFYLEDRELALGTMADDTMMFLRNQFAQEERRKAAQRTRDAMVRKAQAGHVTGGGCFGYRNVEIVGGDGKRSHVEREIEPTEADIVRRIFRLSAEGHGVKAIAKRSNADSAQSPRAQCGRSQTWAPSSVRAVLHRPLYRGEIVWAQTAKRDKWGQKHQKGRPEADWIRRSAPSLRIVTDEEWDAAHARRESARSLYLAGTQGKAFGRPADGSPAKYLLTGLSQCGECGSGLIVKSRSHGKRRAYFYACGGYHNRGSAVCSNYTEIPMLDGNDILIEALLDETLLDESVGEALRLMQAEDPIDRITALERELGTVEQERSRLVAAMLQEAS